jgi:hypothetical protein
MLIDALPLLWQHPSDEICPLVSEISLSRRRSCAVSVEALRIQHGHVSAVRARSRELRADPKFVRARKQPASHLGLFEPAAVRGARSIAIGTKAKVKGEAEGEGGKRR